MELKESTSEQIAGQKEQKYIPPPETDAEFILATRECVDINPLGGGLNKSEIVKLKDDGRGVFKPTSGESDKVFAGVEKKTLARRERAVFLVDKYIGLGLVPETVIRRIDGEEGSFQKYIEGAVGYMQATEEEAQKANEKITDLFLLDFVVWSGDRQYNNLMIKDGRLLAIDNGVSLGTSNASLKAVDPLSFEPSSRVRFIFSKPVAPTTEFSAKIAQLANDAVKFKDLHQQLVALVGKESADAFTARFLSMAKMLEENNGIIPKGASMRHGSISVPS